MTTTGLPLLCLTALLIAGLLLSTTGAEDAGGAVSTTQPPLLVEGSGAEGEAGGADAGQPAVSVDDNPDEVLVPDNTGPSGAEDSAPSADAEAEAEAEADGMEDGMEDGLEDVQADDAAEEEETMKAPTGKRSIQETFEGIGNKIKTSFKDLKKKIQDQYNKQMEKFKETMDKWGDSVKNKFNGLTGSLKEKIFKGNLTLSKSEINAMNKEQLNLLTPSKRLSAMAEEQKKNIYNRFRAQDDVSGMRRAFEGMHNFTDRADILNMAKEIINKLGDNKAAQKQVVMSALFKLGPPGNWTAANITKMRDQGILPLVPPGQLMKIMAKNDLKKIPLPSSSEISQMPSAKKAEWANLIIHAKNASKELGSWTASEIRGVHSIMGRLPVEVINKFPDGEFYNSYTQSTQSDSTAARLQAPTLDQDFGPQQAEAILTKLKRRFKEQMPSAAPGDVRNFVTRLGPLGRQFLTPSELQSLVAESQRGNKAEMREMWRGAIGNKAAPQITRCEVFKKIYMGQNLTELTTQEVNTIVSDGMLPCVPPQSISDWLEEGVTTHTLLSNPGSMLAEGARRKMAKLAADLPVYQTNGLPDVSKLPAEYVAEAPAASFRAATWSALSSTNMKNNIKTGKIKLDPAQAAIFVQKGLSQGSSAAQSFTGLGLGPVLNEMVPAKDLKSLSATAKKTVAMGSSQHSPLRMASAADPSPAIPSAITAANVDALRQPALPQLDAIMLTEKIAPENALAVLAALAADEGGDDAAGDEGLSRKMCTALKTRLAAQTQLQSAAADNDTSILAALGAAELASLPACVTARLWADTVKQQASPEQKLAILSSLSGIKPAQLEGADKENCQNLVTDALKVLRPSDQPLSASDVAMVGGATLCLSAGEIGRLDKQAFQSVQDKFQMGCVSRTQADAIFNRLTNHYGPPGDWKVLPCRLLRLLDPAQQREIPEDRLTLECGDQLMQQSYQNMMKGEKYMHAMMMNCKRQIGAGEFGSLMERHASLQRRQARGVLQAQKSVQEALNDDSDNTPTSRRRRAAAGDLTCDMVTAGAHGSLPWSSAEISQLSKNDTRDCQKELTRAKDEREKLLHVWDRLKYAYDDMLDQIPVGDIGWVSSVIPADDIKRLDLTSADAVAAMGVPRMAMSKEQLEAVATRTRCGWEGACGQPATWTSENLMLLGQIICGLPAADVNSIPADSLALVMQTLDSVHWCPPAVLEKLASKYVELNGNPDTWGKTEVADMGAVIGGLDAQQLKSIKNESIGGVTAAGMMSIPDSKIGMLTARQVGQLELPAALAVSDAQRAKLSSEAQQALTQAIRDLREASRGGATAAHVSQTFVALVLLALGPVWFR